MLARIAQIRERDNLLIESLDQHYGIFHDGMESAYREWRLATFKEGTEMRELKREATTRKVRGGLEVLAGIASLTQKDQRNASSVGSQDAILGGGYLFTTGIDKGRGAKTAVVALGSEGRQVGAEGGR